MPLQLRYSYGVSDIRNRAWRIQPLRRKATPLSPHVAMQPSEAEVDAIRHAKRAKHLLFRGFVVFLMTLLPTGPYVQIPLLLTAAGFGVATIHEYEQYRIARLMSRL